MSSDVLVAGIPLTLLESAQARRLRLRIDPRTSRLILTVPWRMSKRRALAWAEEQSGWVKTQLANMAPAIPFEPGARFPFRGQILQLHWDPAGPRQVSLGAGRLDVGGPPETLDLRVARWLKSEARTVLDRESRELAERIGARLARTGVGDPVSRWGSCSSSGSIRYSWRLILAPDFVRRATVAHEVAHLVHLNHGPAFHRLVEELFGADPAPARLWLRKEGAVLHRVGRRA